MKEIPDYGDLMTVQTFIACVESGGFIDYDGYGKFSDGVQMTDITIYPSELRDNLSCPVTGQLLIDKYTHIVWFNR